MKKLVLIFFIFLGFFPFSSVFANTAATTSVEASQPSPVIQDMFFRAKVLEILDEYAKHEYGMSTLMQSVRVEILHGAEEGKVFDLLYEIDLQHEKAGKLESSDKIIVGRSLDPETLEFRYYIRDMYRLGSIGFILGFFVLISIIFAGSYGLRALLGLVLSFAVIFAFIIPQILAGKNPFLISCIGIVAIAFFSFFIAHGWRKRTRIALFSTLITLLLSLALAYIFVSMTRLLGIGSEEAFYLQAAPDLVINLRGLLLGGIIIGTLGILDDITTAQVAAVEEISLANAKLDFAELYKRGSSVGREHIISLINTLVLAYTGASFPLLLLFHIYPQPLWLTLNSEIIVEELIRMMVGSIALILAVPITTLLAAYIFGQKKDSDGKSVK